jgi:hypothetical protein
VLDHAAELPDGALDGVPATDGCASTGVMTTPVTAPLMALTALLPFVPRASRVAFAFALAAACCSAVLAPQLRGGDLVSPTFFKIDPTERTVAGGSPLSSARLLSGTAGRPAFSRHHPEQEAGAADAGRR